MNIAAAIEKVTPSAELIEKAQTLLNNFDNGKKTKLHSAVKKAAREVIDESSIYSIFAPKIVSILKGEEVNRAELTSLKLDSNIAKDCGLIIASMLCGEDVALKKLEDLQLNIECAKVELEYFIERCETTELQLQTGNTEKNEKR